MDSRITDLKKKYSSLMDEFEDLIERMKEFLSIDIYDLENDCAEHPELYFEVAIFASRTGSLQNRSEMIVKELKAEIATTIRTNPEKYGITKLTESQVFEAVDSAEYAKEGRELRGLCMFLKNSADSLVQAFEHRRSMLNNEVQLYLSKLGSAEASGKRSSIQQGIEEKTKARRLGKHE